MRRVPYIRKVKGQTIPTSGPVPEGLCMRWLLGESWLSPEFRGIIEDAMNNIYPVKQDAPPAEEAPF